MKLGLGGAAEKNGSPRIERVAPTAAIPGGEITIHGSGFVSRTQVRPLVRFGAEDFSFNNIQVATSVLRAPTPQGRVLF